MNSVAAPKSNVTSLTGRGSKPERIKSPGVVDQVRMAFLARNRLPTLLGFIAGGWVPLAIYNEAHGLNPTGLTSQHMFWLVCAGLVFSAITVFQWSRLAFASPVKAFGYVVLLEGVMTTTSIHWLALSALCLLIAINGIATGCILSRGKS